MFLPVYFIQNSRLYYNYLILYFIFYFVILFISTIFLVVILVLMRSWRWLYKLLPHPTGWAWGYFLDWAIVVGFLLL